MEENKKVVVVLNKYEGEVTHPELKVTNLGVKSIYTMAKGGGSRGLYGREIILEGPEYMIRAFLDKLESEGIDVHTDL